MDKFLESLALRECAFGLIDPAIVNAVPNELTTQALVPERLWSSRHLMPILLNLKHLSVDGWTCFLSWFRDSSKYLQQPPVAFFVTTDITADEFARHWNVMQLAQPASTRKFWLRIHDPRVMHQLLRILTPAQRRRLFGRSQEFHYWLGRKWTTVSRDLDEQFGHQPSIGFAGWDWRRIERIGLVNRSLLRAEVGDASEMTTKAELVEQLIERAVKHHGLTEKADLVEFAARALLTNPNFDEHPAIVRAISMTANSTQEANLADHFSLIEEHVWEALRHSASWSMEHPI